MTGDGILPAGFVCSSACRRFDVPCRVSHIQQVQAVSEGGILKRRKLDCIHQGDVPCHPAADGLLSAPDLDELHCVTEVSGMLHAPLSDPVWRCAEQGQLLNTALQL